MCDRFCCHHLTHIGSSGWITDHGCSATDQYNRLISSHLQALHQTKCHKMSYMKTVCGRVKSNIECSLSVIDQLLDLFFVCYLGDQSPSNQFIINCHFFLHFRNLTKVALIFYAWKICYRALFIGIKKRPLSSSKDKGRVNSWYHLYSQISHDTCLIKSHNK